MTGRDGRRFSLSDPNAVIDAFRRGGVDLPVDYDHQNDRPVQSGGPVPAAGWIKDLKITVTGLWGRVEWTAQARELIGAKAYRYLRPPFLYLKEGRTITRLKGADLVHNPNLELEALASQESKMDEMDFRAKLAGLVKLDPEADDQDILDAVSALVEQAAQMSQQGHDAGLPDPSRHVPVEAVQELMRDRSRTQTEQQTERATAKVGDALAKGYITPAMKPWATALCRQDEASFDRFLSSAVPVWKGLTEELFAGRQTPSASSHAADTSDAEAAVCAQLGLAPGSLSK